MDTFLQTTIRCFGHDKQTQTKLPTEIAKLIINPGQFLELVANNAAVEDETRKYIHLSAEVIIVDMEQTLPEC